MAGELRWVNPPSYPRSRPHIPPSSRPHDSRWDLDGPTVARSGAIDYNPPPGLEVRPFRLLDLPPELRSAVYHQAAADARLIPDTTIGYSAEARQQGRDAFIDILRLSHSNRSLRAEVLDRLCMAGLTIHVAMLWQFVSVFRTSTCASLAHIELLGVVISQNRYAYPTIDHRALFDLHGALARFSKIRSINFIYGIKPWSGGECSEVIRDLEATFNIQSIVQRQNIESIHFVPNWVLRCQLGAEVWPFDAPLPSSDHLSRVRFVEQEFRGYLALIWPKIWPKIWPNMNDGVDSGIRNDSPDL